MNEPRAGSGGTGGSSGAASLLLRMNNPDGTHLEFYVADGLTIGRTLANTIVIRGDETVDRTHARLSIRDDGAVQLAVVGTDNHLLTNEGPVQSLRLIAGTTFQIGRAKFTCLSGARITPASRLGASPACPYCGSAEVPAAANEVVPCAQCGQLVLRLEIGSRPTVVVPGRYGAYQAVRAVAQGGMSVVLLGQEVGGENATMGENPEGDSLPHVESDKRLVAIKLILPMRVSRSTASRFRQEVAMLKRVRHPNVVHLLGAGRAERFNYLVMQWIDGQSLREMLPASAPKEKLPSFDQGLALFKQVCKGLAAIHAVGIVHRDLKPSNILIDRERQQAYISDLGIGRHPDRAETALTSTGEMMGTFHYMAPEQLEAPDLVDERTDLYALGVSFYEYFTGQRPVGAWRPASAINPTVPVWFDDLLARLLAPGQDDRFEDVHELIAAIGIAHSGPAPAIEQREAVNKPHVPKTPAKDDTEHSQPEETTQIAPLPVSTGEATPPVSELPGTSSESVLALPLPPPLAMSAADVPEEALVRRWPWTQFGICGVCVGFFLASSDMLLMSWGVQTGESLRMLGGFMAILGSLLFVFGAIRWCQLRLRGETALPYPWLRRINGSLLVLSFLLPMFGISGAAVNAARKAANHEEAGHAANMQGSQYRDENHPVAGPWEETSATAVGSDAAPMGATSIVGPSVGELVIVLVIVGMFASTFLYLRTLSQTLAIVPRHHRKMEPGLVWLNLIPLFNLVWHFYVVLKIRDSLDAEMRARDLVDVDRNTWKIGIALSILALLGMVPGIGMLALVPGFVCWVVYWTKIAGYKSRLALIATPQKGRNSGSQPPELTTPANDR